MVVALFIEPGVVSGLGVLAVIGFGCAAFFVVCAHADVAINTPHAPDKTMVR
jgi:hypothetical protein